VHYSTVYFFWKFQMWGTNVSFVRFDSIFHKLAINDTPGLYVAWNSITWLSRRDFTENSKVPKLWFSGWFKKYLSLLFGMRHHQFYFLCCFKNLALKWLEEMWKMCFSLESSESLLLHQLKNILAKIFWQISRQE
jgi:hypothetical protein